jgi:hypothetical protein
MKIFKRMAAVCLIFTLLACGNQNSQPATETQKPIPVNEATQAETDLIESEKAEITEIAKTLGVELDLDQIPVIVTTANGLKNSEGLPAYQGLCEFDSNGKGRFIILTKEVLNFDLMKSSVYSQRELTLLSFQVLLHEIGHCYFNRKHETNNLEKTGYEFVIAQKSEKFSYDQLPTSIMSTSVGATLPYNLKKYYVAEILGVFRANSAEELSQYTDTEIQLK